MKSRVIARDRMARHTLLLALAGLLSIPLAIVVFVTITRVILQAQGDATPRATAVAGVLVALLLGLLTIGVGFSLTLVLGIQSIQHRDLRGRTWLITVAFSLLAVQTALLLAGMSFVLILTTSNLR
jgi:hypothetical protein